MDSVRGGESDHPDRRCWQATRGPPAGHPQAIGMPSTSRMHAIGGPSATRGAAIASTPQSLMCRRSSNFTAKRRPLALRGAIAPFPDQIAPFPGPTRGNCALSRRKRAPFRPEEGQLRPLWTKCAPFRPGEGQLRPFLTKMCPFPARRGAIAPFPARRGATAPFPGENSPSRVLTDAPCPPPMLLAHPLLSPMGEEEGERERWEEGRRGRWEDGKCGWGRSEEWERRRGE